MGETPTWGLPYPSDYNMPADVPADVQALAEGTEAALDTMAGRVTLAAPVGTVVMYAAATAPEGWHLCNGTAHGSAALQAILGSPNAPDLRDRFVVGAGSAYAIGNTGGADLVTLTAAQSGLVAHSHGVTVNSGNAYHSHGVSGSAATVGNHTHPAPAGYNFLLTQVGGWPAGTNAGGGVQRPNGYSAGTDGGGAHSHSVSGSADAQNAAHAHSASAANNAAAGATASHENRPPYYALTYIIRKA